MIEKPDRNVPVYRRILDRFSPEALEVLRTTCDEMGTECPIKQNHLEMSELSNAPAEVQKSVLEKIVKDRIKGATVKEFTKLLVNRHNLESYVRDCVKNEEMTEAQAQPVSKLCLCTSDFLYLYFSCVSIIGRSRIRDCPIIQMCM